MKKQAVADIQELIEYLLRIRERELIENEENAHLINAFPENNYDLAKTAKDIGVSERTLYRKINKLMISMT